MLIVAVARPGAVGVNLMVSKADARTPTVAGGTPSRLNLVSENPTPVIDSAAVPLFWILIDFRVTLGGLAVPKSSALVLLAGQDDPGTVHTAMRGASEAPRS
jgi:hypothetical protein